MQGTEKTPRVSVFRSNRRIVVQIIDDTTGRTVLSSGSELLKAKGRIKGTKTEVAGLLGELLARKAKEAGISKVVFDRGGYRYHGRVKALADGLRKGGLIF